MSFSGFCAHEAGAGARSLLASAHTSPSRTRHSCSRTSSPRSFGEPIGAVLERAEDLLALLDRQRDRRPLRLERPAKRARRRLTDTLGQLLDELRCDGDPANMGTRSIAHTFGITAAAKPQEIAPPSIYLVRGRRGTARTAALARVAVLCRRSAYTGQAWAAAGTSPAVLGPLPYPSPAAPLVGLEATRRAQAFAPVQGPDRPGRSMWGSLVSDRLLPTRELATFLGLSPETVLRRWRSGELPGYRLGSNVLRVQASEIDVWLEECARPERAIGPRRNEGASR